MYLCIIFIDAEDIQCYIQLTCGNLSKSIQKESPQLSEVAHWQPGGSNTNPRWVLDLGRKAPVLGLQHTSENPKGPSLVTVLLPPPPCSEKTTLSVPGTQVSLPKGPQSYLQASWSLFP